jgi:long-chain acyl-CoA synthetase
VGISEHAAVAPDRAAIICRDTIRSYGELDDRTTRLAHALRARGVGAGDHVAVVAPNSIEWFEAAIAASKLDAAVVPTNYHLKAEELAFILEDAEVAAVVTHVDLLPAVGAAIEALRRVPAVVVIGGDYEDAIADAGGAGDDVEPLTAAPGFAPVFYTSGTTGRPKGVVHGMLDRDVMAMAQEGQKALWFWTGDDVYILSGPAYHAGPGGWAGCALYTGATIVVLPTFEARAWLAAVDRHRVTKSFMVPAHFIRILEVPEDERARWDLTSLRLICHAAAPCPVDVKRRAMAALTPCEIWELYGASEGGATRIGPDEWLAHPGSVGLPWPGVEVRILGPSLEPLAANETGQIYIRPAHGRFHYRNDDAKTAAAWHDGAFTVGDIGHLDDDGYLYITDRASDMVIRGGVNIYPREVEEVLHRHDGVVDCAVFGVPDDRLGETLHAVVEVRGDPAVTADQLAEHCRGSVADFKVPSSWEIVPELPRDPAGKVRKRELRAPHWAGRERSV